jgi:hypothetical protein
LEQAARERALDYSAEAMAAGVFDIYRSLLSTANRQASREEAVA